MHDRTKATKHASSPEAANKRGPASLPATRRFTLKRLPGDPARLHDSRLAGRRHPCSCQEASPSHPGSITGELCLIYQNFLVVRFKYVKRVSIPQ